MVIFPQYSNLTVLFDIKDVIHLRTVFEEGALPSEETEYQVSTGSNQYALYKAGNIWKTSASLTNQRLQECHKEMIKQFTKKSPLKELTGIALQEHIRSIQIHCDEDQQFKLIDVLANNLGYALVPKETTNTEEEIDIQQCKPTIEQIVQDLKANLSEDDQHKLSALIASNIGYTLAITSKTEMNDPSIPNTAKEPVKEISTGGVCDYYRVSITHPMSKDQVPYIAECGDIMESLEMTYAEANIFKEIWRSAAERTLGLKKAGNSSKRAAEKVVFFANRYYVQNVHQANLTDSRKVTK